MLRALGRSHENNFRGSSECGHIFIHFEAFITVMDFWGRDVEPVKPPLDTPVITALRPPINTPMSNLLEEMLYRYLQ